MADIHGMRSVVDIAWSERVDAADWIKDRLEGKPGSTVSSVVPKGYDAYARILHPARLSGPDGDQPVRWADVATWTNMPLGRDSRFHSVALPPGVAGEPTPPWNSAPRRGSLTSDEVARLAEVLRPNTATPEACWFAVWDGHGWVNSGAGLVPLSIAAGGKASLASRDYIVYEGPVEAAAALFEAEPQSPNLWWPEDRSWFVASENDLHWTYVAGTEKTIGQLVERGDMEVLRVEPIDKLWRVEPWVARWVYLAVTELLRTGDARVETSRGTVVAWFERPSLTPGALEVTSHADGGTKTSSRVRFEHRVEGELRQRLSTYLTMHVLNLVEG